MPSELAPNSFRNSSFSSPSNSDNSCSILLSTYTEPPPLGGLTPKLLLLPLFLLNTYKIGLAVSNCKSAYSGPTSLLSSNNFFAPSNRSCRATATLSPRLASCELLARRLLTLSRSESTSSRLITSMSSSGVLPVLMISGSSKTRTTSAMASTSRMWERNLLPRPSPVEAPLTSPAISTNSITAGTFFFDLLNSASLSTLSSGTATTPTEGSIVQKG